MMLWLKIGAIILVACGPLIIVIDFYIWSAYPARMSRGKYTRFLMRKIAPVPNVARLPYIGIGFVTLMYNLVTLTPWASCVFYIYIIVTDTVDWITGGEEPPWRRWVDAASKVKDKLKIGAPPKPAIDLA